MLPLAAGPNWWLLLTLLFDVWFSKVRYLMTKFIIVQGSSIQIIAFDSRQSALWVACYFSTASSSDKTDQSFIIPLSSPVNDYDAIDEARHSFLYQVWFTVILSICKASRAVYNVVSATCMNGQTCSYWQKLLKSKISVSTWLLKLTSSITDIIMRAGSRCFGYWEILPLKNFVIEYLRKYYSSKYRNNLITPSII